MDEETKLEIQTVLSLLKSTCIKNGVSIAVNKENGDLNFFDTRTYLENHTFSGIRVAACDLVK